MKTFTPTAVRAGRIHRILALMLATLGVASLPAAVPSFVELSHVKSTPNISSGRGVPLSTTAGNPVGSDGRAPTSAAQAADGLSTLPPSSGQFQSVYGIGGGAPAMTNWNPALPIRANMVNSDVPRNNTATVFLRRAFAGASFATQPPSLRFGSIIAVPTTDENDTDLPAGTLASDYWDAEPYSTNGHAIAGDIVPYPTETGSSARYYWSANARAVFAIQPGIVEIVWRKSSPESTQPAGSENENWINDNGNFYVLFKKRYVVSGSAVKTPRKLFWTEKSFRESGRIVKVPTARISGVRIVYNDRVRKRVEEEVVIPGQLPVAQHSTNRLDETRTIWFDQEQGEIHAYNAEGRVFIELLGDLRTDGVNRQHLGFEIVDISRQPNPADIKIDIGEILTPYQGTTPNGSPAPELLIPEPVNLNPTESFAYRHTLDGVARPIFYANRETLNRNDHLMHWLEPGEQGLLWPFLYIRYEHKWPTAHTDYSHYVRPNVNSEAEAQRSAVQLPALNIPVIEYQDPLDQPRAKLTPTFGFYTFLSDTFPAHRTLLRYSSGENVRFERVFSWLDDALAKNQSGVSNALGLLATNLAIFDSTNGVINFPSDLTAPKVLQTTALVGNRIPPPEDATGSSSYLAGQIIERDRDSYHPGAYIDPLIHGFTAANRGAIIPVNAIPGRDQLEVLWFRERNGDVETGFDPVYWPAVQATYTLQWPSNPDEIILASNDGSGGLDSRQAQGTIYTQNNSQLVGYNPNEEHALILGGQAFALRDDLNITTGDNYTSQPFVLLSYTADDDRPAVRAFKVLREKPSAGILFDYIVEAGSILQAPMPLPLMPLPIEGAGADETNYNKEAGDSTEPETAGVTGEFEHYKRFTFKDRKDSFWVYRGQHNGPPALEAGSWSGSAFVALPAATAVVDEPFTYHIHASRRATNLVLTLASPSTLPNGLEISGLRIEGSPTETGNHILNLTVTDNLDDASANLTLTLNVVASGTVDSQDEIPFAGGRPPYLGEQATSANSFSMQFYYRTQEGFAWPHIAAPAVGSIVPYLLPAGTERDQAADKTKQALPIVYRPVWPTDAATLKYGKTLTVAENGGFAIRGRSSLSLLYQQSIAKNFTGDQRITAVLFDPTRDKEYHLNDAGLSKIPAGVRTEISNGNTHFPNLRPHLAQRFFFEPDLRPNPPSPGRLVLRGEFVDEVVGEKYLQLNVLSDADLLAIQQLCPDGDPDKTAWNDAATNLTATVETFRENSEVPGEFVANPDLNRVFEAQDVVTVHDDNSPVDSYALAAPGPGAGFVTVIAENGEAFTDSGNPVSMGIFWVPADKLHDGSLKVVNPANPLSEFLTFQHTSDHGGKAAEFQYEWKIAAPVNGEPPTAGPDSDPWQDLDNGTGPGLLRFTLGGVGVQSLSDNYLSMRYRPIAATHPRKDQWSNWTEPQLAEGWIKRVLAGINPFNQRLTDLFSNAVDTDVSLIGQAGRRWEGDVPLNLKAVSEAGLIEIYETVLRRGRDLSINAGINYGPANDALLLAAGYLNDLYLLVGNEAAADAANPTIGIDTSDGQLGDIATSLFAFKGQVPTVLEEELALLRGRNDLLQPGVRTAPIYNKLIWNYTRGINSGEAIYALNYNIKENPNGELDGVVNAADAARLFPQGHGDAYGHFLTAVKGYYSLLLSPDFDWVPRTEAVLVLGQPVQVDYFDERKFAASASALGHAGRQIFDLTWRKDYRSGEGHGWEHFGQSITNENRSYLVGTNKVATVQDWGIDHWAARTAQGALMNWVVGNAIVPETDTDNEGIQKIDRTTVTDLEELPLIVEGMQQALENAEAGLSPLGLPESSVAFDINPNEVTGANNVTHFEQMYRRAVRALNNALVAFDDAKDVSQRLRSQENSLDELRSQVASEELAFEAALIEIYGTPYPDDIGPGRTYNSGYTGPDLMNYSYVDLPELTYAGLLNPKTNRTYRIDIQDFPHDWSRNLATSFDFIIEGSAPTYAQNTNYVEFESGPHGFFSKPDSFVGGRKTSGRIQQSISEFIGAHSQLTRALEDAEHSKRKLDQAIALLMARKNDNSRIRMINEELIEQQESVSDIELAAELVKKTIATGKSIASLTAEAISDGLPRSLIAGFAAGGDLTSAGRAAIRLANVAVQIGLETKDYVNFFQTEVLGQGAEQDQLNRPFREIAPIEFDQELRAAVAELNLLLADSRSHLLTINERLRRLDDANRAYLTVVSEGERIQKEREIRRKRSSALIQGFRTRDASFRIFRSEKLERYKTLFDLAARYSLLAANAYDYETGLLGTDAGSSFISKIISARALGVVANGEPQFAGSNTGDPGLSSALAEMKADWDVLKGRLGFNNPDSYGTTVSLRTENLRILPGAEGLENWQTFLNASRREDILADPDVRRYCLQIDDGSTLPVPGIVIEFSTVIANDVNLFGRDLAAGDHAFSPSSFATKIHAAGVALEGYRGMDDPTSNNGATAGSSPTDPSTPFLDPRALAATPYLYLVPVGVDSMRSPPLGDSSAIRNWTIDDVALPLPFNIGHSPNSSPDAFTSGDSLSEPLFALRKHQAFRPVSSAGVFSFDIYGDSGQLRPSQFTSNRLIGRSAWNSRWKLVIPARTLLRDTDDALDRFIQTVTDIKIHLVTYSYSGN